MKRIAALALALAALSLPAAAEAQALPDYLRLMTVDAVVVKGSSIEVTGVIQGEAAPSTRTFRPSDYFKPDSAEKVAELEACHRILVLALSKPGQYLANVGPGRCEVALVKP